MNGAQESSYDGMTSDLPAAVAKVLGPDGRAAGAGFLVAEGVLVTCAHVVQAAGAGPGSRCGWRSLTWRVQTGWRGSLWTGSGVSPRTRTSPSSD